MNIKNLSKRTRIIIVSSVIGVVVVLALGLGLGLCLNSGTTNDNSGGNDDANSVPTYFTLLNKSTNVKANQAIEEYLYLEDQRVENNLQPIQDSIQRKKEIIKKYSLYCINRIGANRVKNAGSTYSFILGNKIAFDFEVNVNIPSRNLKAFDIWNCWDVTPN